MTAQGYADLLVVADGPEDGVEFPVIRTPFYIGHEPACDAELKLDGAVKNTHVRLTQARRGYRVRAVKGAKVQVNRRNVGVLRSRILRADGELLVGNTHLVLACAEQGLANEGRSPFKETDFAVLLGVFGQKLARLLSGSVSPVRKLGRLIGRHWFLSALALLIVLCVIFPGLRAYVLAYLDGGMRWVKNLIEELK